MAAGALWQFHMFVRQHFAFALHMPNILINRDPFRALIILASEHQRIIDPLLQLVQSGVAEGAAFLHALQSSRLVFGNIDALFADHVVACFALDGIHNNTIAKHAGKFLHDFSRHGSTIHVVGDVED